MKHFLKKGIYTALFVHLVFFLLVFVSGVSGKHRKVTIVTVYGGGIGSRGLKFEVEKGREVAKGLDLKSEHGYRDATKRNLNERSKGKEKKGEKRVEEKKTKPRKKGRVVKKGEKISKKIKKIARKPEKTVMRKKDILKDYDEILKQQPGADGKGRGAKVEGGKSVPKSLQLEYARMLWKRVKEKWVVPEMLSYPPAPAKILVRIAPNGDILEVKVQEGSGMEPYDAFAITAIRSASPFPPPPWNPREPVEILFIFKGH